MTVGSIEVLKWASAICEMVGLEPSAITSLTLEFDARGTCEVVAKGVVFPEEGTAEVMKTWTQRFKVEPAEV